MPLLFDKLNYPDLENFLNKTVKRSYPPNNIIFNEGEISNKLYLILNGSVSIVLTDENNREIIIAYLSSGDFFG